MERLECDRHPGWVTVWCNACITERATADEPRVAALERERDAWLAQYEQLALSLQANRELHKPHAGDGPLDAAAGGA